MLSFSFRLLYVQTEDGEPEASHPAGVEGALERLSVGRQHQEELPQRNHVGLPQSRRSLKENAILHFCAVFTSMLAAYLC